MRDLTLNDGEILKRVGELKTSVFVVLCGHVVMAADEASGDSGGHVFGPGSVLGVSSAAAGRGTAPSLCAHGEVCLRIYGKEEARAAAQSGQDESSLLLAAAPANGITTDIASLDIARLDIARLDIARLDIARLDIADPGITNGLSVRLVATEPAIAGRFGGSDFAIDVFPFVVGRQNDSAVANSINLPIQDRRPFQLSRRHFMIDRADDTVEVRDCGSNNGTIVNGAALGGQNTAFRAALLPGENEIIAGTASSPFRFLCTVEPGVRLGFPRFKRNAPRALSAMPLDQGPGPPTCWES